MQTSCKCAKFANIGTKADRMRVILEKNFGLNFWFGPTAVCYASFVLQSTVNQVQWESTMITVPPAACSKNCVCVCLCVCSCMHACA